MTQPHLISAEIIEASRVKPPARPEWFAVVYLTRDRYWRLLTTGRTASVFLSEDAAERTIEKRKLRDARIVRIPGEGTC